MKLKWPYFLLLCLYTLQSYASPQDSSKVVSLISYLSKGETLNYSVVKTRIDSSSKTEPKITENRFNFKITVTDSTDTSYRFTYYRSIDLLNNEQLNNLPQETINKFIALSQQKIEYETDELGSFKRVINEDQILDKIKDNFDELKSIAQASGENEQQTNLLDDIIGSIDPKVMISLYSQDILALHFALGLSMDIKDTIAYEEEIIAPILNIPIKSQVIFYCDTYDEENDFISYIEEKVIEDDFMEKIIEFFQKHENTNNPIPVDEFKNMKMDIYIQNTYQYNSYFGVPIAIELYKEISVNAEAESLKRIEIYTISLEE